MIRNWLHDRMWQAARALPGTSEHSGPTRRLCTDIESWIAADADGPAGYTQVEAPVLAPRPQPGSDYAADDRRSRRFQSSVDITSPPEPIPASFVATLPGGRILGADGSVVAENDTLLAEVSLDLRAANHGTVHAHAARHRWRQPLLEHRTGRVAALAVLGGHNYYHWMFNLLPRIALLRQAGFSVGATGNGGIDWFAVNRVTSAFQRETLVDLGIPQERLIQVDDSTHLKADTLIVPSRPSRMSDSPSWVCEFLRRTFLPPDRPSASTPSRLYLTRRDSPHRHLRNESDVQMLLERRGYVTVSPEMLSVAEQARLLHGADIVVAPHGAALTNLVFCRPGVTVVEMFSPTYINGCYWMLSAWMRSRYHYLLGVGDIPQQMTFDQYGDLEVDLAELNRLLRRAERP